LSKTNWSCILLKDCFIVLALTSPIPSTSSNCGISAANIAKSRAESYSSGGGGFSSGGGGGGSFGGGGGGGGFR
jgi:uncharacterized membrane protein